MLIRTGISHNYHRVYRLIGRDLYSAPINKPLKEQEYTLDKPNAIGTYQTVQPWRVIVREGEVCLES